MLISSPNSAAQQITSLASHHEPRSNTTDIYPPCSTFVNIIILPRAWIVAHSMYRNDAFVSCHATARASSSFPGMTAIHQACIHLNAGTFSGQQSLAIRPNSSFSFVTRLYINTCWLILRGCLECDAPQTYFVLKRRSERPCRALRHYFF